MKETFYFSHDYNSQSDEKILELRMEKGWEGYGIYWALIEKLASNKGKLDLSKIKSIAFDMQIDNTVITEILYNYNLFIIDEENGIFYNARLLEHFNKRDELKEKKSEAGKKGMAKRWGKNNTVITENNTTITDYNKGKESKGKESKELVVSKETIKLETYIKHNFDLEFIKDIYNKYGLTKKDFQEECENFVLYWKEKSINGKKEKWEKEKTFNPKLRFRMWMKNNKKWNSKKNDVEEEKRKERLAEIKRMKEKLFNN